MTNDERRLKLFERYNQNWRLVKQRYQPPLDAKFDHAIICPLCGIFYTRDSLSQKKSNPWTLEDVPPKVLNGRALILTCKKCNNLTGHTIDAALIDFVKKKPFMDGVVGSEIYVPKTTIEYNGGRIVSSAVLKLAEENTFHFTVNIKKGEARYTKFSELDKSETWGSNFHFHTPSIKFVQLGLLKVAYLRLFHKFGHVFSFNKKYEPIRRQILNPTEDLLSSVGVMQTDRTDAPVGIYLFKEIENLKSFIVVFDLVYEKRRIKNIVFIPSPFIDANKFYEDFNAMDNFKFRFNERFTDSDFLTDPKLVFKWLESFLA